MKIYCSFSHDNRGSLSGDERAQYLSGPFTRSFVRPFSRSLQKEMCEHRKPFSQFLFFVNKTLLRELSDNDNDNDKLTITTATTSTTTFYDPTGTNFPPFARAGPAENCGVIGCTKKIHSFTTTYKEFVTSTR